MEQFEYKNEQLKNYLNSKSCFKLICGANNEDYSEIASLVKLYHQAGARFFDINASKIAIDTCKKAIDYDKNSFICVSIGTKNDPHMSKCKINSNCTLCKKCIDICPQSAIVFDKKVIVEEKKCIGCKKCQSVCKNNSIESYQKEIQIDKLFDEIKVADCIEFHIITDDIRDIFEKWEYLVKNYKGFLSIALNRSLFSDKIMFDILSKMLNMAKNNYVMIQADGKSMSGGIDDYNSTLQAVATADILRKSGFSVPIIISGGTNSKSFELSKLCNVDINGVAVGSYARYIIKNSSDPINKAKELILSCAK